MNKYQNGKIYKIVNDELGLTYFGSSCNLLHKRFYHHKSTSKDIKKNISSKILFSTDFQPQIFLVEAYPCENKLELEKRERYYIENFECVNKCIPTRTKKEYTEHHRDDKKEYDKRNYLENKDKKDKYAIDYQNKNKEKILAKKKERYKNLDPEKHKLILIKNREQYQNKKEERKEFSSKYYKKNRDKILEKRKEKIECPCGSIINKIELSRHKKTLKHLNFKI